MSALLEHIQFRAQFSQLPGKRHDTRMFSLEKTHCSLSFLFHFKNLPFQFRFFRNVGLGFAGHVDRTNFVAIIGQNLFGAVEFRLDHRQLAFQKFKSLFGFCATHFDVLAQISPSNGIQNGGCAIRIAVAKMNGNNTRLFALFSNTQSTPQSTSGLQRRTLCNNELLTFFCKQELHTNNQGITGVGDLANFPNLSFKNFFATRSDYGISVFAISDGIPLFGTQFSRNLQRIQIHTTFHMKQAIPKAHRLSH